MKFSSLSDALQTAAHELEAKTTYLGRNLLQINIFIFNDINIIVQFQSGYNRY